jgi:hypothetical protein
MNTLPSLMRTQELTWPRLLLGQRGDVCPDGQRWSEELAISLSLRVDESLLNASEESWPTDGAFQIISLASRVVSEARLNAQQSILQTPSNPTPA